MRTGRHRVHSNNQKCFQIYVRPPPNRVSARFDCRVRCRVDMFHRAHLDGGSSHHPDGPGLSDCPTPLYAAAAGPGRSRARTAERSEACSSPPAPLELVLVVSDVRRCKDTPTTLGKAVIVPDTGGILATVYFSCVERFATSAGTDFAVLLGRVAAHELGHLMLNSSVHAHHGLMRPHWTLDEVRLNRAADWVFTAGDVAAMHAPPAEQ